MEDLIKHIRYLSAVTIIWIDGKDGSGKSYLATELAKKLMYNVIHVDGIAQSNTELSEQVQEQSTAIKSCSGDIHKLSETFK